MFLLLGAAKCAEQFYLQGRRAGQYLLAITVEIRFDPAGVGDGGAQRELFRLLPLIAALQELPPWQKQWHNEVHPAYGERMGSYYASFVEQEARALGSTLDGLRNWQPPVSARTRKQKGTA